MVSKSANGNHTRRPMIRRRRDAQNLSNPKSKIRLICLLALSPFALSWMCGERALAMASSPVIVRRSSFASVPMLKDASKRPNRPNRPPSCLEARGGGDKDEHVPPPLPTLEEIRKFAVPCFAVWVAAPMLSMVDTATVGLSASPGTGPTRLGALGPA
eukprot:CAMPEP_0185737350 /NCGR_PEP_ID=MMETSP1171-20130828/30187_1 /TAXON_ID=374046 /ORGANISM="Helicotheca tamensis, Strain CCMP826" /LENGTH=157 /DNA_ID=CAMNT_0028408251 /DNA_START=16 /DNA_END=485 /DNA_ORIENTATION=+